MYYSSGLKRYTLYSGLYRVCLFFISINYWLIQLKETYQTLIFKGRHTMKGKQDVIKHHRQLELLGSAEYLALSIASVLCTLESWPRQKRSPPEGSTYPSTVTIGQLEGTLNVSPTCTSISKYAIEHQYSGAKEYILLTHWKAEKNPYKPIPDSQLSLLQLHLPFRVRVHIHISKFRQTKTCLLAQKNTTFYKEHGLVAFIWAHSNKRGFCIYDLTYLCTAYYSS